MADVFGKGKGQTFRTDGLTCQVTTAKLERGASSSAATSRAPPRPIAVQAPHRSRGTSDRGHLLAPTGVHRRHDQ